MELGENRYFLSVARREEFTVAEQPLVQQWRKQWWWWGGRESSKSSEWGPFLFQFRKMAKIGRWTEKEKRDSLLACLRGKAITYIQTKPKYFRTSYESLKSLLEQRYGMTELPATARRQLSSMKQEEGDTLEDFADRVIGKTGEGYLGVPEETLQVLATEAFLRGCRDRNAAYAASERKPETLCKAVEEMRDAAANLKAFNRGSLTARQVTFVTQKMSSGVPEKDGKAGETRTTSCHRNRWVWWNIWLSYSPRIWEATLEYPAALRQQHQGVGRDHHRQPGVNATSVGNQGTFHENASKSLCATTVARRVISPGSVPRREALLRHPGTRAADLKIHLQERVKTVERVGVI